MRNQPRPEALASESTETLVLSARTGNESAIQALYDRHIDRLERWAGERLRPAVRHSVQSTLLDTLHNLESFDPDASAAFQTVVRKELLELSHSAPASSSSEHAPPPDAERDVDRELSPVERALGSGALERYERALERLPAELREAVVARIEMGLSYPNIALELGRKSPEAARELVHAAILRLAEEMRKGSDAGRS
jgi:RNA polymerase sigma-70 factor (ECF subfamily)